MRVGYLERFLSYDQVTVSGDYDVGICSIYCTHCQMHHCPINLKVRQHVYFFQMLRFMFGEKFNLAKYPGLRFRDSLIKIAPLLQPNENFPCWASDSIYCTVAQHMKRRWILNEMRIIQLSCHNSVTPNFFGDLFVIYPTKQLGLAMDWWKYPVLVLFCYKHTRQPWYWIIIRGRDGNGNCKCKAC